MLPVTALRSGSLPFRRRGSFSAVVRPCQEVAQRPLPLPRCHCDDGLVVVVAVAVASRVVVAAVAAVAFSLEEVDEYAVCGLGMFRQLLQKLPCQVIQDGMRPPESQSVIDIDIDGVVTAVRVRQTTSEGYARHQGSFTMKLPGGGGSRTTISAAFASVAAVAAVAAVALTVAFDARQSD